MEKIKKDVNEQENRAIQELENDSTKEKESEVSEKKVRKVKKQEETVAAIQEEKTEENEETEIVEEKVENLELPETEERKSKVGIILIIIAIIVVIIALTTTIFAAVNLKNTKILKGISIGKTDVSELTQEEAEKKLEEIYSNNNAEKKIYLSHGSYETSITYEALEVKYHIEKAVKEAYKIGRQGNVFQDNIEILKTWNEGKNVNLEVSMDNDMIEQIAQNINNSIDDTVVQPSYYIEENKNELVITAGKKGQKVDEEKLLEEIYKVLDANTEDEQKIEIPMVEATPDEINIDKIHEEVYKEVKDAYYTQDPFTVYPEEDGVDFDVNEAKTIIAEEKEEYVIPLKITKPTKTVKDIGTEAFPDLLATFSTNYNAENTNRTTNLKLAVNKINGTVLLPNEEFSYNKVVGERTISAGYKMAATYSNGAVVDGLGGGICQISSTLYDAVVMANLNVTTRRNHQFVTSYVPAGKDATVVWGSQDFKFVNSRKNPIRITATVQGGVATVQIWGVKEEVEYDISIETKKIATIEPTTKYVQNSSLPAGQQKVVQAGSNGRKVEAYKVTKLNGKVISTTLLSRDTYNAMQRIVHVGTGQ